MTVLGVDIYAGNIDDFTADLISSTQSGAARNRLVSARDAHGIVQANKNEDFKNILNQLYCNLPDGMPIVWVGY